MRRNNGPFQSAEKSKYPFRSVAMLTAKLYLEKLTEYCSVPLIKPRLQDATHNQRKS